MKRLIWLAAWIVALPFTPVAEGGVVNVTHPSNLLANKTVTVSSSVAGSLGVAAEAVDNLAPDNNQDASFLFGASDANQRMSITGFNGGFSTVRIYSAPVDGARAIGTVVLRSSTSSTSSLNTVDYPTLLGSFTTAGRVYFQYSPPTPANNRGYFDMLVNAPSGTQSLLLDLGSAGGNGERLYEVQALVPEPATALLLLFGMAAFWSATRRARHGR